MINKIRVFFANLSSALRFVIFLMVISIVGITLCYYSDKPIHTAIASVIVSIFLLLTTFIWLPEQSTPKVFKQIAKVLLGLIIVAFNLLEPLYKEWLSEVFKTGSVPRLGYTPLEKIPTIILIALLIIIYLFDRFFKDNTGMGKHPDPIERDIPDIEFKQKLVNVCESLNADLRVIDYI